VISILFIHLVSIFKIKNIHEYLRKPIFSPLSDGNLNPNIVLNINVKAGKTKLNEKKIVRRLNFNETDKTE